jgi:hypothetical protein
MFCGVDKGQEHNIKDIKVTYRSQGPNIDWEYLKKLHPAIRVIRALTVHLEKEFGTVTRGNKHTIPRKDEEVLKLRKAYRAHHGHEDRRDINSHRDKAADYSTKGCVKFLQGRILAKWIDLRTYERGTRETWLEDIESDDEEDCEGATAVEHPQVPAPSSLGRAEGEDEAVDVTV